MTMAKAKTTGTDAAAAKAAKAAEGEIFVMEVKKGIGHFCILGTSPLICNRMSEKTSRELLLPKGKKNAAEKASTLKHEPMTEYRNSPYRSLLDGNPTRIQLLSSMFKGAMRTAALDLPGTKKAQIGRLTYVVGDRVNVFGTPQIFMSITRSADMNRTPDVRTRAILPRWACQISVNFVEPIINLQAVTNLLAAGGITSGIGDWRIEKGSGSYGSYRLCSIDDPEYQSILQEGREAQDAALESPEAYDDETASLLAWYDIEVKRRGFKAVG
jgi:hypothetical protein